MMNLMEIRKKYQVLVPEELEKNHFTGPVSGYFHEDTEIYNLCEAAGAEAVGEIHEHKTEGNGLIGYYQEGKLCFEKNGQKFESVPYAMEKSIFSRNDGILETDWMMKKTAFFIGCGSVGSLFAIMLARSGVGTFVLIDNDVVEYGNIARSMYGVMDVGSFKVNALKKMILLINPKATVVTCMKPLEMAPQEIFDRYADENSIFAGCADNREADCYANQISMSYGAAFLSVGFWERAAAGEIFYHLPEKQMPCYKCALGKGGGLSERTTTSRRFYTMEKVPVHIQPGIGVDVFFITMIAAKLAVDILNRFKEEYIPELLQSLRQFTLVCNTNDPRLGGDIVEIFAYPLQVTRNIKVEGHDPGCPCCREKEERS